MEPLPNAAPVSDPALAAEVSESSLVGPAASETAWRNELSARLNRYRARRKAPPPRYPSLKLPFEAPERPALTSDLSVDDGGNHGFALEEAPVDYPSTVDLPPRDAVAEPPEQATQQNAVRASAKIIEFPGFAWGPPAPPADQLAEPVMDRPRILEVPEVAPAPPALGGITIESSQEELPEKRVGVDIPLEAAPLGLRLTASFLDGIIIAAACALFGFIFWKVAAVRPPRMQLLALAAGIPCLFWAAYQYLLIVYSGSTPGLRLTGLRLERFDGTPTNRSQRRWRVLAAWLSAASLGMGYVWALLDEDVLCWHDRITHTHLASTKKAK